MYASALNGGGAPSARLPSGIEHTYFNGLGLWKTSIIVCWKFVQALESPVMFKLKVLIPGVMWRREAALPEEQGIWSKENAEQHKFK